ALLSLARRRSRRRGLGSGGHCKAGQSCGAEVSQAQHEDIRPTAEDRHRRTLLLFCGDERDRQRRSPGGRSSPQQSRGEFASAVSTTRERHAALSKREDVAEIQFSSRPGPQPFQSGAPSRHAPSLQAETLCGIGRVARPRGLTAAWTRATDRKRRRAIRGETTISRLHPVDRSQTEKPMRRRTKRTGPVVAGGEKVARAADDWPEPMAPPAGEGTGGSTWRYLRRIVEFQVRKNRRN